LTLLPSLTCPAEDSAAACLGTGVAALVAARAATDLAAGCPLQSLLLSHWLAVHHLVLELKLQPVQKEPMFLAGNAAQYRQRYIACM